MILGGARQRGLLLLLSCKRFGLLDKFLGAGLPQFLEILKLSLQAGKLLEMRHTQQRPFRFGCDQREEKPALIDRQIVSEFPHRSVVRGQECVELNRLGRSIRGDLRRDVSHRS